jgi:predicted nuclease with RNAse H fold
MEALQRSVAETTLAVNGLTSRWGRFVEELVEPAVVRMFQERGIDVKEKHPRVSVKRQGLAMEIDILVVDTTDVVLVECKSRLSRDDVNEFIEKLERFKVAFPAYKNYQAYGAVAGIEINEGVDRYAYQKGLFVIRPSGDTVEIVNDQKFNAKTW